MAPRLAFMLALAVALSARAQETTVPAPGGATNDDAAKRRYELLLEKVEDDGHGCAVTKGSEGDLETLKSFVREVQFVAVERDKPITVVLPESFFHPRGRTLTFDRFELVVNRDKPDATYISLNRTNEGVVIEAKYALSFGDGRMFCVRGFSATKAYAH